MVSVARIGLAWSAKPPEQISFHPNWSADFRASQHEMLLSKDVVRNDFLRGLGKTIVSPGLGGVAEDTA